MANVETVMDEEWALRNHFKKVDNKTAMTALDGALQGIVQPDKARSPEQEAEPRVTAKEVVLDGTCTPEEPGRVAHDEYQTTKLQNVKRRLIVQQQESTVGLQKKPTLRRQNSKRKLGRQSSKDRR